MTKLNPLVVLFSCALLAACGSTPTPQEGDPGSTGQWLAGRPFVGSKARPIKTPFTPRALSRKPVKVMLELAADPITIVQSLRLERKLNTGEKQLIRDKLRSTQGALEAHVGSLGGLVLRGYQNSYNGLAVQVQRDRLSGLAKLPGVVGVHEIRLMKRGTTKAVPFVGAPAVWNGALGFHGEHVKVAILDSGIDYTHADFGGPGTAVAYEV